MADSPRTRNTSQAAPRATVAEWQELERRILEGIDVESVYRSWGVQFTGRKTGDKMMVHAHDRVEKGAHDSASVNVGSGKFRGCYYDFGGTKPSYNIWTFGEKYGGFSTWRECRRHLAGLARVTLPDEPTYVAPPRAPKTPSKPLPDRSKDKYTFEDIGRELDRLHAYAVESGELGRLATHLRVNLSGLRAQRVGFAPVISNYKEFNLRDRDTKVYAPATTWPEWQVRGVDRDLAKPQRQSCDRRGIGTDKRKEAMWHRPRGISIPIGWHAMAKATGHMFIGEGGSDVAALYSMDLGALGVPMKGYAAEEIALLIARANKKGVLPAATPITVMVDRDAGGFYQTQELAQTIAQILKRPVAGRFPPSIMGYRPLVRPEDYEFPPERYPFLHDPSDPRWLTLAERKGVAKDVREWLGWVCNADTLALDRRQAVGRRFMRELAVAFDVSPKVMVPVTTCVTERRMEEGEVKLLVYGSGSEEIKSFTGVPPSVVAAPPSVVSDPGDAAREAFNREAIQAYETATWLVAMISPLMALPVELECPNPCYITMGDKYRVVDAHDTPVPCLCWNCGVCCNNRKATWGKHLAERFGCEKSPAWHTRSIAAADRKRLVQYVRRKGGQYVRILTPGGSTLLVANVAFPGATATDLDGATRDVVNAIVSVVYKKGRRFRPVSASHQWKLPPKPTGKGHYEKLCHRFRDRDASHAVLAAFGITLRKHPEGITYWRVPTTFTFDERRWAAQWAYHEVPPPWVAGDPVPDPAAFYAALVAPSAAPPASPKPVKPLDMWAQLRAWAAAARASAAGAATIPTGGTP